LALSLATLWRLARQVERLFELDRAHGEALEKIAGRLAAIEERLTRLEARDEALAAKAAAAATAAAALAMSDLSRRIGALEERGRLEGSLRARLPPPPGAPSAEK
jgi:uncharacterized protein YceH (UPF0502 family)